jgi:hypothetical protein
MASERGRDLTLEESEAFAQMVLSGAPVTDAVRYFWGDGVSEAVIGDCACRWPEQAEVRVAIRRLSGGVSWHEMEDPNRMDAALKKHYNELAYFLWTTNYVECDGTQKVKADTCRSAIESKVAGMAGKESPLASFYHDLLLRYDAESAKVQ